MAKDMRLGFLNKNAKRVFQSLQHLPAILRVAASGLFDADEYKRVNPECRFGALRCLWHWVRHGYPEGRIPSESPLVNWLLPKVTTGELKTGDAKNIKRAGASGMHRASMKLGLNLSEYKFLDHYLRCNFVAASKFLEQTDGLFYLRAVNHALRAMPAINNVGPCYEKILSDPASAPDSLSPSDLVRLRNIAFAAGAPWATIINYNRQIAKTTSQRPSVTTGEWAIFRTTAEQNALSINDFVSIRREEGAFVRLPAQSTDTILFMPDEPLWSSRGENEQLICEAFKMICKRIIANGVGVIPLPAPFTRNLSAARLPPFQIVSYHTYAANRPEILHYKETSLRGVFFFDLEGYSGASQVGKERFVDVTAPTKPLQRMRERYSSTDLTKCRNSNTDTKNSVDVESIGDYVFVPLQVLDDSAQRWQDMTSWKLLERVAACYAGSNVTVVAKRHPYDRTPFTRALLSRLSSEGKIVTIDAPIQKLLARAKVVFTANSGAGFEALLIGKPVICSGRSEYHSCAYYCNTEDDLMAAIQAIKEGVPADTQRQTDRFLSAFFERTAFEVNPAAKELLDGGFRLLDRHVAPTEQA